MKLSISQEQYEPLRANGDGEFSFWPGGGIVYHGKDNPAKSPIRGLWSIGTGSNLNDSSTVEKYEHERPTT